MAELLGASSSKKRQRAGEEGEGFESAAAAADEEDRILALPEDLRLRILALLPLNSAIRTGALSTRWRALWAHRWPAPSSLDLHLRSGDAPKKILESLQRRGLRRLDRFSLTMDMNGNSLLWRDLEDKDPQRFLDYAAACGVEDLHIDAGNRVKSKFSTFKFPTGCPHLARLVLRRIARVSIGFFPYSGAFPVLEVLHLHLVSSVHISKLLWACPLLKTLYLSHCDCDGSDGAIDAEGHAHLRSLTVAECNRITHIDASRASGLRSFRLSSASLPTYNIAATAPLEDLYISLRGRNFNPIKHWIQALPDLANLTVLTICSIALRRVYALDRFGSATCLTKLRYLPSLRELQLVMLEMDYTSLAHMYTFFRCCMCPQLERLFVQLPSSSHDIYADNSLEVAEEDELDEELYEDDDPDEEEDESVEEEDESVEELLSEGYEAEEELLLEQLSEEYMLKERLYYEDVYEEDRPEENVPEDEQFEEVVPKDEQSEEDVPEDEQSEEDVPLYGLNNLVFAKLMKFKGHYFEMRLVSFLLRRATGLQKLLLVPPVGVGNYMEALGEEPLDTSGFLETILDFEKASPDAEIVLSDSDPTAIQPLHSDVF
ncbi:unnamed protein product [Urochloa decumbens]|uniref:F-box domain-containing protein n=1 Tax=Urochloa decumbens TaxID=240449 RepID=A0ABC9E347_9POAL